MIFIHSLFTDISSWGSVWLYDRKHEQKYLEFLSVLPFRWSQEYIFESWNLLSTHHNLTPAAVAWVWGCGWAGKSLSNDWRTFQWLADLVQAPVNESFSISMVFYVSLRSFQDIDILFVCVYV